MGRRKKTGTFEDWFSSYAQQNGIDASVARNPIETNTGSYKNSQPAQKSKTVSFNDWFSDYAQQNGIDPGISQKPTYTQTNQQTQKPSYIPPTYLPTNQQAPSYTQNPLVQAAQNKVASNNGYVTGSASGDKQYQRYLQQMEQQVKGSLYRQNLNNPEARAKEKEISDIQNQLMNMGKSGATNIGEYIRISNQLAEKQRELGTIRSGLNSELPDFSAKQAYYDSMDDATLEAYRNRIHQEGERAKENLANASMGGVDWMARQKYTQEIENASREESAVQKMLESRNWNSQYQDYMSLRNQQGFDGSYQSTYKDNGQYVDPRGNLNGVGEYVQTEMGKYGDITYDYLNNDQNAQQVMHTMNPYGFRTGYGTMNSYYANLSNEEKQVFNHLYKQDPDKAYEFMDFMKDELERRERVKNEEAASEFASENPVAASMLSVSSALGSPIAVASDIASAVKTGDFNVNAWGNQFSYIPKAIRQTVSQNIAYNSPFGEAGSFLYNTGMSMADNMAQLFMTGGMSEATVLALMGTQVFSNAVTDGVEEGKTTDEIMFDSFVQAGIEVLTEKIGLDEVFAYMGGKRTFEQLLKAAGSEGAEEALSDILNWGMDGVRQITTGRESEMQKKYNAYRLQGFSQSEALAKVISDMAKEAGTDALGGALSGFAMAGGGAVIADTTNGFQYQKIGREVREALPDNSQYQKMSDKKLGRFASDVAMTEENETQAADILKEAASTMNESGYADYNSVQNVLDNENAVQMLEDSTAVKEIKNGGDVQAALRQYAEKSAALNALETATSTASTQETQSEQTEAKTEETVESLPEKESVLNPKLGESFEAISYPNKPMSVAESDRAAAQKQEEQFKKYERERSAGVYANNYNDSLDFAKYTEAMQQVSDAGFKGDLLPTTDLPSRLALDMYEAGVKDRQNSEVKNGRTEVSIPGERGRNDVQNSGRQGGSLAQEAGRTKKKWSVTRYGRTEDLSRLAYERSAVSSLDLGIKRGTASKNLYVVTSGFNQSEQGVNDLVKAMGAEITPVLGNNLKNLNGTEARAAVFESDGKYKIVARMDHPEFRYENLSMHEIFHLAINKEVDSGKTRDAVVNDIYNDLSNRFTDNALDRVLKAYSDIYAGAGMTESEIKEELLCDMMGAMNVFETNSDNQTIQAVQKLGSVLASFRKVYAEGHQYLKSQLAQSIMDGMGLTDTISQNSGQVFESREIGKKIVDFANEVATNKIDNTSHIEITDSIRGALANDISAIVGFDVTGWSVDLNASDLRHADKRHGENGRADSSMRDLNEYAYIADIEDKYSSVKEANKKSRKYKNRDNTPAKQVEIEMPKGDGSYYVVEAVPETNRKTIHIVSVYQTKKAVSQVPRANGLGQNVQNGLASTASNNYISRLPENNKSEFDMKMSMEVVGDLIAVHNIFTNDIEKALDLGGFPMPSIAITKAEMGHANFGDVSLVFGKETIDPERSVNNKVYSGDAWTPTFPTVDLELNEKMAAGIYSRANKVGQGIPFFNPVDLHPDNLERALQRAGSEAELIDSFKNDYGMKQMFLSETGKGTVPYVTKEREGTRLSDSDISLAEFMIDTLDRDTVLDIPTRSYRLNNFLETHKEEIANAYEAYINEGNSNESIDSLFNSESTPKRNIAVFKISNILQRYISGDAGPEIENDRHATEENIDKKIDTEEFSAWLEEMLKGINPSIGFRNNMDPFTPSGNRRKWSALHMEVNLENAVKSMRSQEMQKGSGFLGMGNPTAAATREFRSIKEIKRHSSQLQTLTEEEYESIRRGFTERFNGIVERFNNNPDQFGSLMDTGTVLCEDIATSQTKQQLGRKLKSETVYGYKYSESLVDDLWDLVEDIRNMPTGYFEAKPRRAVTFDEVRAAVVPNTIDENLLQRMTDAGVKNVVQYKADDEADRLAKLNSLENVRFSREITWEGATSSEYDRLAEQYSYLEGQYKDLQKENKKNAERYKYFKGETKLTKNPQVDIKDAQKVVDRLTKEFDSVGVNKDDLAKKVQAIATDLKTGKKSFSEITDDVIPIANEIVRSAKILVPTTEEEIVKHIHDTKIRVSDKIRRDIADYNGWRRSYFGRITFSLSDGMPVEDLYNELRAAYGNSLFPPEINNPTDQLMHITDIVDNFAPQLIGAFGDFELAEATESVAFDMLQEIMETDIHKTFADKKAEQIENIRKKDAKAKAEAVQKVRTEKNEQIEKIRKENTAHAKELVKKVRDNKNNKIKEIRQHYKDVAQDKRIRRAEAYDRNLLLKTAQRLDRMKTTKANRVLIEEIIGDLDLVAVHLTGSQEYTKAGDPAKPGMKQRLEALKAWYEQQRQIDPDFIPDPYIEDAISRLEKKQIADLDIEDVRDLTRILRNIENEIRTQNKLIDSEDRRDIYIQGVEAMEHIYASAAKGKGVLGTLDDLLIAGTLSPERAIHRYTGYVDTDPLYLATKKLSDGQRATMDFSRRADDLFTTWTSDRKFLDEIQGRNAKEIEITGSHDGKPVTVKITPAMRMSLYLHSLNPDNLYHIAHGGVRVPDIKLYKQGKLADAYAAGKLVTLTPSAIRQIAAKMTPKERAFARAAHDYFNGMSQKEINEVSEKLVGYSLAEVENYFPINSDKKYTHSDTLDEFVADSTIQGGGFLKARVKKAGNAIMLRDMNSVLNQSIADTSRYVGLAIPVRNFKKIWNVSTPMFDENGEFVAYGDGVQEAVAQHWGTKGTQYVENLISDIDGNSRKSRSRANKYLNQIRSNYAGAVLTLNLSVAMKQAASYPTAAAVLGWKPLLKAFTRYGAVDTKLIAKYTPLLYYRTKGFSTTELGDIAQSNNWFNRQVASHKWLNWVQAVDLLTTKKLWKAAEIYVEDNYKELKPGTDEFYERVADMYNQTIEETQPNYTTMQRPDILRDDNALLQTVIMFKTQPFQNFNIIYDAIGNWSAKMQQYKANPNEETKEALKAAGKKAKDASSALIMSMLVFAAMTFAYSMLRGGSDKYKDKDGNTTAESIFGGIGKDMASGFAGTVPFGAEAWELIASELFGEKYYGLDSTTITAISDFVDSCKSGFDSILDIINEPEKDRLYWQKKRLDWDKILKNTSKAYGVPYDNVEKLFNIMISKGLNLKGEYSGRYEYLKLTESASYSSNKSDYYDNLYAAYNNDPAQFREIYFDMRDFGFSEEAIKKAIEDRMKKEQGVSSVKDLNNRFVAPKK